MDKENFIVSNFKKIWIKDIKNIVVAEPFIYEKILEDGIKDKYDRITIVDFRRKNKEELERDSNIVFEKYHKYIKIISTRLNHIHKSNYPDFFWANALSLSFVRYITLCRELYLACKYNFNSSFYVSNILSENSYKTPKDFEEQREFLQATDIGQEQLFSIFMLKFYPKCINKKIIFSSKERKFNFKSIIIKFYLLIHRILNNKSKKSKLNQTISKVKVGFLGGKFSQYYIDKLKCNSNNEIDIIFPVVHNGTKRNNKKARQYLSKSDYGFDEFDNFFFKSFESLFPKYFIEDFKQILDNSKLQFSYYPKLKSIISESWIFSTPIAVSLALFKYYKNVRHISCEHNALTHPFIGCYIEYLVNMCDVYYTIGWKSNKYKNIKSGASLKPFYESRDKVNNKSIKVLYISGPMQVKMPLYWSQYGLSAENAKKHLDFVFVFFQNLDKKILKQLQYRSYPKNSNQLYLYDKESYIKSYIHNMTSLNEPSQTQMMKSELIIVDYISTAHLESISNNIPTVFFFNRDVNYLRDEYADFFEELIDVGICQTDPIEASKFIKKIFQNPLEWWNSSKVQKNISIFLKRNLNKPEIMYKEIMSEYNFING